MSGKKRSKPRAPARKSRAIPRTIGVASAVTSLLTLLAALPYTLGDIAVIIPSEWKPHVVAIGAISTTLLRVISTLTPNT